MFFLFFPLPFSVNSVPSALASVKNKISLTMRSPPCLASVPSPAASAPPIFLPGLGDAAAPRLGAPLPPPLLLSLPSLAWGGCGRRRDEARAGEGATSGCVGLTSCACTWVFVKGRAGRGGASKSVQEHRWGHPGTGEGLGAG